MLQNLLTHNPDLRKLTEEGYILDVLNDGYILVKNVEYLNSSLETKIGTLVSPYTQLGDRIVLINHQAWFIGEYPCYQDGKPIESLGNLSNQTISVPDKFTTNFAFSHKMRDDYSDFYSKFKRYIDVITSPVRSFKRNNTI